MIKSCGHSRISLFLFIVGFILFSVSIGEACRFWVSVGAQVPREFILDQLIDQEYSLKHLGSTYSDGWSIGYYDDGEEVVIRGDEASNYNEEYADAVRFVANFQPQITMGHLRRASSGCVDGVPNPHPFRIKYNGVSWLFGHNGGMKKKILIDLIGESYLKKYPPSVCAHNPPDSWIDSELYFIFLMKTIEEYDDNVLQGLSAALRKLYGVIDEDQRYFNFFLTNGEHVWVFRKGESLHYLEDKNKGVQVVSSTIPNQNPEGWQEFPEDTLGLFSLDQPIRFYPFIKQNLDKQKEKVLF